jgi:MFS family permease
MSSTTASSNQIQWNQLLSLAALYASVTIGWIAYFNYQPVLLDTYNLGDLKLFLYVATAIIMVITPLIAGKLGDYYRVKAGQRLPIISAGISFAAMIFMAVAFTVLLNPDPDSTIRFIIPLLVILWLFSMAIFTSPAISTIELFVPQDKLPTAMAILTIVYGLLYALEPVIITLVNILGPAPTFILGGVAVFGTGLLMKRSTQIIPDKPKTTELKKSNYTYSLCLGFVFGLVTTILFNLFPDWLSAKGFGLYGLSGDAEIAIILGAVAICSWPISRFVQGRSINLIVLVGIVVMTMIISAIYFFDTRMVVIGFMILFSVTYAMMSVSFLPLALSIINDKNKVFGVGVFFAGFELPNGILEAILVAQGVF